MALLLAALLLGGCSAEPAAPSAGEAGARLTPEEARDRIRTGDAVFLFAANVGKGDALILRVGDYVCLIDTGKPHVYGRLRSSLAVMGADAGLDAVFVTHTDSDHVGGLEWLAPESGNAAVPADAWYASAMVTGVKREKHPAAEAAGRSGHEIQWLRRGDAVPLGDTGATLRVLAPASLHEDEDDNSLVMLLESDQGRMLLTGDLELPGEAELLSFGDDLGCAVLKVANHGDGDATGAEFARAAGAQVAVISTDSLEKPGTPDPGVLERLRAAGSRVAVTQDAGLGVLVTLSGGVATAEYVDIDAPLPEGLSLAGVDAEDDRIALKNSSGAAVALDGFSLFSDRGNELYAFPDGARIEPGATLVIGTRTTDGEYDLLWDDKKVIHRKKTDVITLYDGFGRVLDQRDNGI